MNGGVALECGVTEKEGCSYLICINFPRQFLVLVCNVNFV